MVMNNIFGGDNDLVLLLNTSSAESDQDYKKFIFSELGEDSIIFTDGDSYSYSYGS